MLSRCPNRWLDFCHEALAAFAHGEHGPRTSAHQEGANVLPLGPYERGRERNADAKCPRWLHLDKTNRRARAKRRASHGIHARKGGDAVPGPRVVALSTGPGPDRTYKRALSRLLARLCSRSCVHRSARLARGPSEHDIYAIDRGNAAGQGSFASFNVGETRQEAVGGIPCTREEAVGCSPHKNV